MVRIRRPPAPKIESQKYLEQVRKLLLAGKIHEAQKIADEKMLGHWSEAYMPMGYIKLHFDHGAVIKNYRRTLELETGIASVCYQIDTVNYKPQLFCVLSRPCDGIAIFNWIKRGGAIPFKLEAKQLVAANKVRKTNENHLILEGQCPDHAGA